MTYLPRFLVCVVVLAGASTALGSSAAPNVQVNVKQGRTKVFTTVSDMSGRFTTPPLQPGVYTFELRALKTAPPAHYFLVLSGAKPVTAPMADKKAVLMMDAQVRTPRSVNGQVTARRIRIVTPAAATAGTTTNTTTRASVSAPPQATATRFPNAPGQNPVVTQPTAPSTEGFARRPAGYGPRMINGRPHEWVPISDGSDIGRWRPVEGGYLRTRRAPTTAAPAAKPSPTPKPAPAR